MTTTMTIGERIRQEIRNDCLSILEEHEEEGEEIMLEVVLAAIREREDAAGLEVTVGLAVGHLEAALAGKV